MRKPMLTLMPTILTLTLLGGAALAPANLEAGKKFAAADFMPLAVGNKWYYRSGKYTVMAECERQETVKMKRFSPKKDALPPIDLPAFRLNYSYEAKTLPDLIGVAEDGVYRFSSLGKEIDPPLQLFKWPVNEGENWTVDSMSQKVPIKGTFKAAVANDVEVPAGKFSTVMVSSKDFQIGAEQMEIETWFAPKVGIVKQRIRTLVLGEKGKIGEVLLELEKYEVK